MERTKPPNRQSYRPGFLAGSVAALSLLLLLRNTGFAGDALREPPERAAERKDQEGGVQDEARAHAIYDRLLQTIRCASSLSYESDYRWTTRSGQELNHSTYRLWLKKPGYARLEVIRGSESKAVLIGDGEQFWTYWPTGRPLFPSEDTNEYEKFRPRTYMKELVPADRYSIAHQTAKLGTGMHMLILEPSVFHGYVDPMQPYLDGVRAKGTEKVGQDDCDVIEASFMKGQRWRSFWLSKRNLLPRELRQVIRLADQDQITEELWSQVRLDEKIPAHKFSWKPPRDWQEYQFPTLESGLLKPGTQAPLFSLRSADGTPIRLSDYRGKVVWLVFWRTG